MKSNFALDVLSQLITLKNDRPTKGSHSLSAISFHLVLCNWFSFSMRMQMRSTPLANHRLTYLNVDVGPNADCILNISKYLVTSLSTSN